MKKDSLRYLRGHISLGICIGIHVARIIRGRVNGEKLTLIVYIYEALFDCAEILVWTRPFLSSLAGLLGMGRRKGLRSNR